MNITFKKSKEKYSDDLRTFFNSLDDGVYILNLRKINGSKTVRDFQNEYFALVESVSQITGNIKNEIHENYKLISNVQSTKNFSVENWLKFIFNFKKYYFDNLDIIL